MHLRQLIQEQNRLSSAKAAIGSDELIAIVFLDMAGEEVRSIISAAYQTEAPQHTAFPISSLNKEFLQPAESWLHFSDLYFFLVYLKC